MRSGPAAASSPRWARTATFRIITDALYQALAEEGVPAESVDFPWYFPRTSRYVGLLEDGGFDVTQLRYFARPTPLDDCPNGLADWIAMFGGNFTDAAPPGRVPAVIETHDRTHPRSALPRRALGDRLHAPSLCRHKGRRRVD